MTAPLLEVRGLTREFGGITAVGGVSFEVRTGEIKALIGPNGAGKTTTLNLISGALAPSRGSVLFGGQTLPVLAPHAVARRGIARTFQLVKLFDRMTVLENVLVGSHGRGRAGWVACAFRTRAMRAEERRLRGRALEILSAVGLAARADAPAATLPYGEQRMVELARALAMEPAMLLLDEPAAGLDPDEHRHLARLLRRIRDDGATILLVDHHMDFVLDLADDVLVLCQGRVLAEGAPGRIRSDPQVIAAYLGEEAA